MACLLLFLLTPLLHYLSIMPICQPYELIIHSIIGKVCVEQLLYAWHTVNAKQEIQRDCSQRAYILQEKGGDKH